MPHEPDPIALRHRKRCLHGAKQVPRRKPHRDCRPPARTAPPALKPGVRRIIRRASLASSNENEIPREAKPLPTGAAAAPEPSVAQTIPHAAHPHPRDAPSPSGASLELEQAQERRFHLVAMRANRRGGKQHPHQPAVSPCVGRSTTLGGIGTVALPATHREPPASSTRLRRATSTNDSRRCASAASSSVPASVIA